jgi:ribonucleoside-diphosphate reductase alpha chain
VTPARNTKTPAATTKSSTSTSPRATKRRGLSIPRHFTEAGVDPFSYFTFVRRPSRIGTTSGVAIFEMAGVEVPDFWDQTSIDILASKYLRKTGVPQYDEAGIIIEKDGQPVRGPETSFKQAAHRLANAWRLWGERGNYFASPKDAQAYYDEMVYMLCAQMAAPNSPVWFNAGLFEAYGIEQSADGSWYYDPSSKEVRLSSHRYERTAASACYISDVEDKLVGDGSIFDFMQREARLFSQGSGSGANLSKIRAEGESLTAGGTSSGVLSFARVLDAAAGAIKSGGSTRRAAKMVILDADHPEVEAFIWSKAHEEKKAAALIAAGYDGSYEGEAVRTVAFQNANHSVRITPGFMHALDTDAEWELLRRTDGQVAKTLKARQLWREIAEAAWECADPGLQFDDILNDWNTVADTERVRGTNPCSEYTHVDDTACNLASLNLVTFLNSDGTFNIEGFEYATRLWALTLEITVSMSHYPAAIIAARSYEHRTLGLGYANLGAMLMRSGLAYDSPEARAVMGAVTALLHNRAYATSGEIAEALGPCVAYEANKSSFARVMRNHRRAAYGSLASSYGLGAYEQLSVLPMGIDHQLLASTKFDSLTPAVLAAADDAVAGASKKGYRNAQISVLAPTGTIGLLLGCDTTGVEPDFALVKMKKLAGGGHLRIINQSVPAALASLGYDSEAVQRCLTYALGTATLFGNTAISARTLLEAQVTGEEIEAAQAALGSVSELARAFDAHVVGDVLYERSGVSNSLGESLLEALGFSAGDLRESSLEICGHLTLEGAPDLSLEHLPVFDCAVECGDGTRSIAWRGHVEALAAVAPHISGSISKTVNLPNSASIDDIERAYRTSYDLGVKCVAIYRDGSKVAQPLSSAGGESGGVLEEADWTLRSITPGMSPTQYYEGHPVPRFRPPNPRAGLTWRLEIGGEELYLHVNTYEDGSPAEIFVDWGRQGSVLKGMTSALSIAISHALQRGMPVTDLVKAFRGHSFEPSGIVVGHANLKMASSVIDAIARILGYTFDGRDDLVQVPGPRPALMQLVPTSVPSPQVPTPVEIDKAKLLVAEGKGQRVYGLTCPACGGSNLIQAGTCHVCQECGETTGCS